MQAYYPGAYAAYRAKVSKNLQSNVPTDPRPRPVFVEPAPVSRRLPAPASLSRVPKSKPSFKVPSAKMMDLAEKLRRADNEVEKQRRLNRALTSEVQQSRNDMKAMCAMDARLEAMEAELKESKAQLEESKKEHSKTTGALILARNALTLAENDLSESRSGNESIKSQILAAKDLVARSKARLTRDLENFEVDFMDCVGNKRKRVVPEPGPRKRAAKIRLVQTQRVESNEESDDESSDESSDSEAEYESDSDVEEVDDAELDAPATIGYDLDVSGFQHSDSYGEGFELNQQVRLANGKTYTIMEIRMNLTLRGERTVTLALDDYGRYIGIQQVVWRGPTSKGKKRPAVLYHDGSNTMMYHRTLDFTGKLQSIIYTRSGVFCRLMNRKDVYPASYVRQD